MLQGSSKSPHMWGIAMLRIGDFSKLARISVKMLRHYDELGLLTPAMTDPETNYRYYQEDQLPIAGRIRSLRAMGFGLADIGRMLEQGQDASGMMAHLKAQRTQLQAQARALARQIKLLDSAVQRLGKDRNTMKYNVSLVELPERQVASVRAILPNYEQEGMLWQMLMNETAPLRLEDGNPCYTTAIFHDKEYKEEQVDVEVQKSVKGVYPDTAHVRFKTVPPVLVASATYQGSYEHMNEVTEAVACWVRDNGYAFHGPAFNIYHVSPHETDNPDDFVTEVCFPVQKA